MIKLLCAAMILLLTGCTPTATAVGNVNVPVHYTYAPGYNPPQVSYPDVPVDADSY